MKHAAWYEPATKAVGHWPQVWCVVDRSSGRVEYVASTKAHALSVARDLAKEHKDQYDVQDLTVDCYPSVSNWL